MSTRRSDLTSCLFMLLTVAISIAGETGPKNELDEARAHLRRGEYRSAITLLRKQSRLHPEDPALAVELGRVLLYDRQDKKAIETLQSVLKQNPDFVPAKVGLARAFGYKHDYWRSNALYWEILLAEPRNDKAHAGLIRNLINQRRLADARRELANALQRNPYSNSLLGLLDRLNGGKDALPETPERRGTNSSFIASRTLFLTDSVGNRIFDTAQTLSHEIAPRVSAGVELDERFLSSTLPGISSRSIQSAAATFRARLTPAWTVNAAGGMLRFSDGLSKPTYRFGAEFAPSRTLTIGAAYGQRSIAPTARAAAFHLTARAAGGWIQWRPQHWQLAAEFNLARYSDGNRRVSEQLQAIHWFGSSPLQFGTGYQFRHLTFDRALHHGYFSPLAYNRHNALAGLRFAKGDFSGEYTFAVGAEDVSHHGYRPIYEAVLANRWRLGHFAIQSDYLFFRFAQPSGAFRAHGFRLGIQYNFGGSAPRQ